MTLTTTEELKHLASSDNANELTRRLARECLANREAQPVALVDRRPAASGSICWQNGGKDLAHGTELFTAPPAPAVPEVLENLLAIVRSPRALPRRKEWVSGQQYSYVLLENVEAMVDEACRAAMLKGERP